MTPLQECYSQVTTAFGAGGSMYTGGHRGADYRRSADQWIYAYDDFLVQSIDSGDGLGFSVGVWRKNLGGFAGFAHIKNLQAYPGSWVLKGEKLAQVAGWNDYHGDLWTGPHIHTTAGSVSAYNCSVGIRPLVDPVPNINYMVFGGGINTGGPNTGPAGGGTKPIPPTVQEDEMPKMYTTQNTKQRVIKAMGTQRFLNDDGQPVNLVGAVGRYQITLHVYGRNLKAGEELDLYLIRHDVATGVESPHYIETIKGEGDGVAQFKRNVTFAMDVKGGTKGTVVVAEMRIRGGDVTIDLTGSEALCFNIV